MSNDDDLTPSEDLMVDVLLARLRTGEVCWTFAARHTKTARSLSAKGLVDWKSGVVQSSILVFPTQALRTRWMGSYVSPVERGLADAHARLGSLLSTIRSTPEATP